MLSLRSAVTVATAAAAAGETGVLAWSATRRNSPADATANQSSLASLKSRMVYLSGAALPRLSWKKAVKRMYSVVVTVYRCCPVLLYLFLPYVCSSRIGTVYYSLTFKLSSTAVCFWRYFSHVNILLAKFLSHWLALLIHFTTVTEQ